MPPISTGNDADFGVTRRFAPMLRSSRFTRSLTSSITTTLIITPAAAKPGGVESEGDGLAGPLDGDDADRCAVRLDRKTVQHAVAHHADRYAHRALRNRKRHGCRKLGRGFGVDELS